MKALADSRRFKHTILRQRPSFVAEQIFYPPELLWQCTGPDDRAWDLSIRLNLVSVYGLAHVKIDPQATRRSAKLDDESHQKPESPPYWNDRGEQNEEAEYVDVPLTPESVECDE